MAAANSIPDKLINAATYLDGDELLGTGSVTLPDIQFMKETMEGLGIAGQVETPVIGHVQTMTLSFSWNTLTDKAPKLMNTLRAANLTIMGSMQFNDAGEGLTPKPFKLAVKTLPGSYKLGKGNPGKKMDNESEVTVQYLKLDVDGQEVFEIDPLNFKCVIAGEDQLATVRGHLGK